MSAAEYRKIIAVDFDGTLAVTQFPTIIEPKWNEIAICKALKKQGTEKARLHFDSVDMPLRGRSDSRGRMVQGTWA